MFFFHQNLNYPNKPNSLNSRLIQVVLMWIFETTDGFIYTNSKFLHFRACLIKRPYFCC